MTTRSQRKKQERMMRNLLIPVAAVLGGGLLLFGIGLLAGNSSASCSDLYGDRDEIEGKNGWCSTVNGYDKVALVVGNTQNSPVPELDEKSKEIIADAFFSSDPNEDTVDLPIISAATGNAVIDLGDEVEAPGSNMTATKNILSSNFSIIEEKIATDPGVDGADYFNAILKAADQVSGGEKSAIIVIGSGYSDSGKLNFHDDDLLTAYMNARKSGKEHEYIVSLFSSDSRYYGDELEDIDIYWVNLGDVVSPQMDLQEWKKIEENIYSDAFDYLGVNDFDTGSQTPLDYSVETEYTVETVIPSEVEIEGKTFSINEKIGIFYPDEAVLKNEADVLSYLKENIADNYSNESLKITGYLAFCISDEALAKNRAEKIKELLVSLGIPSENISTAGMPGSPITNSEAETDEGGYTCNSTLPETDRRTVIIEVE